METSHTTQCSPALTPCPQAHADAGVVEAPSASSMVASINGGTQKLMFLFLLENPIKTRMMTGRSPISGNLQLKWNEGVLTHICKPLQIYGFNCQEWARTCKSRRFYVVEAKNLIVFTAMTGPRPKILLGWNDLCSLGEIPWVSLSYDHQTLLRL